MNEQELLECMADLKAIASTNQNKLTMPQIQSYLADLDFDEDKLQAVYRYLAANQIHIEGYHVPKEEPSPTGTETADSSSAKDADLSDISPAKATGKTSPADTASVDTSSTAEPAHHNDRPSAVKPEALHQQPSDEKSNHLGKQPSAGKSNHLAKQPSGKHSASHTRRQESHKADSSSLTKKAARNLALYRREVAALGQLEQEELIRSWQAYLAGDPTPKEQLIHMQLPTVMDIADSYKRQGLAKDELIAEGNLGIMLAMEKIRENAENYAAETLEDIAVLHELIRQEIRQAIEQLADQEIISTDRENTIVAKTNLLNEAAKYLAEENEQVATREELAEFTRLSLDEVNLLLDLSDDTKGITKP